VSRTGPGQRVELVDEDERGRVRLIQPAEQRTEVGGTLGRGVANHHGQIDNGQRAAHVVGELNGAGTVEDRPGVTQQAAVAEPQFRSHRARRVAAGRGSGGGGQQRLEQGGFAAPLRADQRE
jgi:hypothetical protein